MRYSLSILDEQLIRTVEFTLPNRLFYRSFLRGDYCFVSCSLLESAFTGIFVYDVRSRLVLRDFRIGSDNSLREVLLARSPAVDRDYISFIALLYSHKNGIGRAMLRVSADSGQQTSDSIQQTADSRQ